ncbi:unnamed protein product [Didymodactylos carnosus]|uniref:ubiquitinyl hydrolase 1 n=1 Tax=Didymodactylos carnosus TaxID=1234261 RepID=A0A813WQ41_9BILA|nr:unnamed protein product [Didymodactylos carnosus]CAF1071909.1 unnamed protein product [Didymodactylos carnosus]CAF3644678.1 unnamed protein product [Didymodactylos carnosus]CAF3836157.1 unnamed protein product [Didymodactylos carnosus]
MNEIEHLTGIYHEKQEGALCAQHALNNLLQKEIFSAISLADIAKQLDDDENLFLSGAESHHQQPHIRESQNMDDTGFFSIQVLQRALEVFDIELISYNSSEAIAEQARQTPTNITAYICNLREHWLTIRRFGLQYFDLNSISAVPKLISNTYLSLYLVQLQHSGYSIFIVNGVLPPCVADERLSEAPVDPKLYNQLTERLANSKALVPSMPFEESTTQTFNDDDDEDLKRALEASVQHDNAQDEVLQKILQQSLFDAQKFGNTPNDDYLNQQLLEQAIAVSLNKDSSTASNTEEQKPTTTTTIAVPAEQQQQQPTIEELRLKRLQFFEQPKKENTTEEKEESNTDKC